MENEQRYERVGEALDAIEAELKRLGRWSAQAPAPERFENMGAFGSRTMAFEQWLQWVLLPKAREIIEKRADFPTSSSVSVYAVRELDGDPEADGLLTALSNFDALF